MTPDPFSSAKAYRDTNESHIVTQIGGLCIYVCNAKIVKGL